MGTGNQWGEGRPMRMRKGGSILEIDTRTLLAGKDLGQDPIEPPYIDASFGFPGDLSKVPNNQENTQGNGQWKVEAAPEDTRFVHLDPNVKKADPTPGGGW